MKKLNKQDLIFFAKNGFNVLFEGAHGVGKTAMVSEVFNELGLKWKYFSAATIDPWVDLIGIPKETSDKNVKYLEFVRPKEFALGEVEAIFLDEYNRSHKKVRNAVMELIQFKTINGVPYKNLKMVWAAINPAGDDEYDVENLDPAQRDRFHIHIQMPNQPDLKYFKDTHGSENGKVAIEWWKALTPALQKLVSPRRLDYALEVHNKGGDINYVLNSATLPQKLSQLLSNGSISERMVKHFKAKDTEKGKEFIQVENNYTHCLDTIKKDKKLFNFYVPLMEPEKIVSLITEPLEGGAYNKVQAEQILDLTTNNPDLTEIFRTILTNDNQISQAIKTKIKEDKDLRNTFFGNLRENDWGMAPINTVVVNDKADLKVWDDRMVRDNTSNDEALTMDQISWVSELNQNMINFDNNPLYFDKVLKWMCYFTRIRTPNTIKKTHADVLSVLNHLFAYHAKTNKCTVKESIKLLMKQEQVHLALFKLCELNLVKHLSV